LRNRNVKLHDIAVGVVTALSDHLLPLREQRRWAEFS